MSNLCLLAKGTSVAIGEDSPSLRSIAFEHYIGGDIDLALDFYEKAVDKAIIDYGLSSSYISELYFEMGALAFDNGKFSKAEVYLGQAVKQNPNSVMARIKLAELLRLREKPGQALQQIRLAIAKHRTSPQARGALVSWLQSHGNPAQTIRQSFILSQLLKHKTSFASEKLTSQNLQITSTIQSQDPLQSSVEPQAPPGSQQSYKETKTSPKSAIALIKAPIKPKSSVTVPELDQQQVAKSLVKLRAKTVSKHSRLANKRAQGQRVQTRTVPIVSAIKTTAKRIKPKILNATEPEPQKSSDSEATSSNGFAETETEPKDKENKSKANSAKIQSQPAKPELKQRATKPSEAKRFKTGRPKASLVPPPPPTVPYYGPPPFVAMPVAPAPKQESKTKPKPKEKLKETEDKHPTVVSPSEGDPEFILEWSGVNARKKH